MIVSYPLNDIWPVVKPKIEALRQRYPDFDDWTVDGIHEALVQQRAFLLCCDEDDSFAIVKVTEPGTLFIWIAYGIHGRRERNMAFLREIARSAGTSRMEMTSPRRGFHRMPGWTEVAPHRFRAEV